VIFIGAVQMDSSSELQASVNKNASVNKEIQVIPECLFIFDAWLVN